MLNLALGQFLPGRLQFPKCISESLGIDRSCSLVLAKLFGTLFAFLQTIREFLRFGLAGIIKDIT
ncbi:hypothetical protein OPIT5_09805 [Opitutaceae bacterium TAV5]|nr:hypothetical protein OPIT5_09805 [Opitutaceae bacterium TAV5]